MYEFYVRRVGFRRYRTCTDSEPRYFSIRHVNGIGQGRGEGAQAGSAYDAHLGLSEVLWDALGEEFEASNKGQLSVSHDVGRLNLGANHCDQVGFF